MTFVVPVRDDAARLRRCLASIAETSRDVAVELIVADNGSTDPSPDVARQAGARVLLLPGLPVAQMRNRAAAEARSALIAFVDADHEIGADWVRVALSTMTDPAVWAAGAEYNGPTGSTWVQQIYNRFRSHHVETMPVDWLPSGNLIVRREAFERVRGFDETLESCEDVDFCRRIRQGGGVLLCEPALRSTHFGDPRTLKALFLSELWRGRDNLRVSLRESLTLRSAPSLVIPIIDLFAIAALLEGTLTIAIGGARVALLGLGLFVTLAAFRTAILMRRTPAALRGAATLVQTAAVAATYDLARALALVVRVGHGVRRRGATR
jgi:GT2 family glycosyltransferase